MDVFVSVGTNLNSEQEAFVCAVEERLRALGLHPSTIGRNLFSTQAPLRAVVDLMDRCVGVVVIAVERYQFDQGVERRGSHKQRELLDIAFPTAWNQIEATMAYSRGLPLLVLVDERLRCEGLLEKGNDWFVQELAIDPSSLNNAAFNGLLGDWRERIARDRRNGSPPRLAGSQADPANMTIGQLVGALKPSQLWTVLVGAAGALFGAFAFGAKLGG